MTVHAHERLVGNHGDEEGDGEDVDDDDEDGHDLARRPRGVGRLRLLAAVGSGLAAVVGWPVGVVNQESLK